MLLFEEWSASHGKDLTEIIHESLLSFADGIPSQRKERVLNTWHLLAQDELSLLGGTVDESIDDIYPLAVKLLTYTVVLLLYGLLNSNFVPFIHF